MDFSNTVAIVTGGAGGIGKALAGALHKRGAKVAVCDLDGAGADAVGQACGGFGRRVDVSDEGQVAGFINEVERRLGPVGVYFSNAGVGYSDGPLWEVGSAPNAVWEKQWSINVMASVYAARHVIPGMVKRGQGVFLITASAAGVLNQIGDSAYSATKAAALSFAESIAITHGDDGVRSHVLCPQYVKSNMTKDLPAAMTAVDGILEADDAAELTLKAIEDGQFLIYTHQVTGEHFTRKAGDRDRWLHGMRKLRRMLMEANGGRPI
ncbi:MAG TPA: short-chain dehydrogenase [Alphaproteobacteria bacterium]|jgi:NAD(P)-dependent dehydrogenase (short-subunit alcohol dehydrogenase family)|nr:short-chain dehydrogenase [Alphaproteobacteria bacterium]